MIAFHAFEKLRDYDVRGICNFVCFVKLAGFIKKVVDLLMDFHKSEKDSSLYWLFQNL